MDDKGFEVRFDMKRDGGSVPVRVAFTNLGMSVIVPEGYHIATLMPDQEDVLRAVLVARQERRERAGVTGDASS